MRPRPAFTLLELVLAMLIMSVIAVVVMPVTVSATESYVRARELRGASESVFFAMDRVVRTLREAPASDSDAVAVASATAQSILFTDGSGLRLADGVLEIAREGNWHVLLRDVELFELTPLADDGLTQADAAQSQRFHVRLRAGGLELSAAVFPRVGVGGDDA